MRIAIDAMGGDFAPQEIVQGAIEAARHDASISVVLCGDEKAIRACLPSPAPSNLSVHHCSQTVEMDESPSHALRQKKDSGVAVATRLHAEGKADVCLSAGNTGAASAFALFTLGRIKGIDRPGIATVFPTAKNPVVLLDAGANVDCKPSHLADFAIMGAAYLPAVRGIIPGESARFAQGAKPTVGLLSIGEEEAKGNELTKATFPLLKRGAERGGYEFVGNIEGRDIFKGTSDVVVCDGFVGNVVLKLSEGMAGMFIGSLKEYLTSSVRAKAGGLLAAPALRAMRKRFDHTGFGGAVLLGVNGTCIICHGSAKSGSIASAIRIAKLAVDTKVSDKIRDAVATRPDESSHDAASA